MAASVHDVKWEVRQCIRPIGDSIQPVARKIVKQSAAEMINHSTKHRRYMCQREPIIDNCDIGEDTDISESAVIVDSEIGNHCKVWRFTNIYGTKIGNECMIGSFVEIQEDSQVGDRTRIQSHSFLCSLVSVKNDVFISHGVKFTNDLYPPSGDKESWQETNVNNGAVIGTNATILPVDIGESAMVGAGAVVVDDVPSGAIVVGNPAEIIGYRDD